MTRENMVFIYDTEEDLEIAALTKAQAAMAKTMPEYLRGIGRVALTALA